MKKELLGSLLTLTAGIGMTGLVPQMANAKHSLKESKLPEEALLKLAMPARYTTEEGEIILGRIVLSVSQGDWVPEAMNLIHAEMSGTLLFQSSDGIKFINLASGNGTVLLDLIHSQEGNRIYQVYGCNSTLDICDSEKIQLLIEGNKINLSFQFSETSRVETLSVNEKVLPDGSIQKSEVWSKAGFSSCELIKE